MLTTEKLRALRRPPEELKKSDQQDQRVHNRTLLLRLLRAEGPRTRPQLSRLSGLSVPAVTTLIGELSDAGVVCDIGIDGAARVGKPASYVQINDDGAFVVAVDTTARGGFVGAVFNLAGEEKLRLTHPHDGTPGTALDVLMELLDTLIDAAPLPLVGIGVASHGLVDDAGIVHLANRFDWRELPLGSLIAEKTGLPTIIGNDVDLMALGIRRFRRRSDRDLIAIAIDHGAAGAAFIDGRILLGEQFAAGELGHLKMRDHGHLCPSCGGRGCLDTIVSGDALRQALAQAPQDREALLADAGQVLGDALAPVVNFLNVSEVAVIGDPELVPGTFLHAVDETVRSRIMPAMAGDVLIDAYTDGTSLALIGAASEVFSRELGLV
ncbi:ROK family protein [Microbacterium esteraromaticum]|uniref:ROK family protein n=1 Tax=Microbacterium esteraromaticum TaxID=57043 RepID=UPI0023680F1C|nr:ROK family protein [Microbacterium esteraromaticum]WDH78638.1 ROK family protein [Microbacterium esteraromaticum]